MLTVGQKISDMSLEVCAIFLTMCVHYSDGSNS